jgi:hypothetical protein
MAAFIGRPERAEDPWVNASVGEFLEKELCHHRMSMEDLADNQRISFAAKGLYLALRGHAPRDTPADAAFLRDRACRSIQTTLDLLGARALETWDRTVAVVAERDAVAAERDAVAAERDAVVAERDAVVVVRDAMVAERDAVVAERDTLAAERDELAVRENRLLQSMARLESDLRHVTLERDVQARESEAALRTLQEIRASCAWRLVVFLRHLSLGLLPAGTRRRRIFNAVLRRLAQRADVALQTG